MTTTTFTYDKLSKEAQQQAYENCDLHEYINTYTTDTPIEIAEWYFRKQNKVLFTTFSITYSPYGMEYELSITDMNDMHDHVTICSDDIDDLPEEVASKHSAIISLAEECKEIAQDMHNDRGCKFGYECYMAEHYPEARYNEEGELVSLHG